jgi:hypothetical protein
MIKPMKRKGVAPGKSACFYAVILEVCVVKDCRPKHLRGKRPHSPLHASQMEPGETGFV